MTAFIHRLLRPLCIGVALCGLTVTTATAETTTSLSANVAQVGQPVVLIYRFVNTDRPEDMPRPSIAVDGLDIRYHGMQTQSRMSFNFGGGRSQSDSETAFEFQYVIIPDRPGDFTIPGFNVRAGGKLIRTQPANLRVAGGNAAPPAPAIPNPWQQMQQPPPANIPQQQRGGRRSAPDNNKPYFGEIVTGTKSAYVGEIIPIELRFYFRANANFDNLQRPSFGGEGFTAAPLSEPEQTEQEINGALYNVVTFRSAITPVKSGTLEIPSAVMEGRMITQSAPSGLDPFFDQFFGNFPGIGHAEIISSRTAPGKLEVQSLPKEGRPENFSGAVGQFTLEADAAPRSTGAGEPVTLKLSVSGRGNFDAIAAPELTDDDGWRTYSPKKVFTAEDSRGFGNSSGTMTFEFSMIARQDRQQTPGARFSYFDPRDKKYVTLTSDPVAVHAVGSGAKDSTDALAATSTTPTPDVTDKADETKTDENFAQTAAPLAKFAPRFEPEIKSRRFLVFNVILLLAALLSIPWLAWMRRRANKSALTSELEATLRRAETGWRNADGQDAFYHAATQYLLARFALWENKPLALINPHEVLQRRISDPALRRELEAILEKCDELKYGRGGTGSLDPRERANVAATLDKLSATHA